MTTREHTHAAAHENGEMRRCTRLLINNGFPLKFNRTSILVGPCRPRDRGEEVTARESLSSRRRRSTRAGRITLGAIIEIVMTKGSRRRRNPENFCDALAVPAATKPLPPPRNIRPPTAGQIKVSLAIGRMMRT